MPDYTFTDKDTKVQRGPEAKKALEENSDGRYLTADEGITKVPHERWRVAQAYEGHTWMVEASHAEEDRNEYHKSRYDDFRVLSGKRFAHAIELGCGPFTNLRSLSTTCQIDRCTLLDPLIDQYVSHRHCRYKDGFLRAEDKPLAQALGKTVVHRALRRAVRALAPQWLAHGVPVAERIAAPIEEMNVTRQFDLVVMINVIEHCYDVQKIFATILKLIAPGGFFVFSDKYYHHAEVTDLVAHHYDAGHPLRVDRGVLDRFMQQNFESCHLKVSNVDGDPDHPESLPYEEFHFIGRRLPG